MPINPNLPADGIAASKAELRANLLAAKDGVEGDDVTNTGTTPVTITNANLGTDPFDAMDYSFKHNNASAVAVTLGTGVPKKKTVMVTSSALGWSTCKRRIC